MDFCIRLRGMAQAASIIKDLASRDDLAIKAHGVQLVKERFDLEKNIGDYAEMLDRLLVDARSRIAQHPRLSSQYEGRWSQRLFVVYLSAVFAAAISSRMGLL